MVAEARVDVVSGGELKRRLSEVGADALGRAPHPRHIVNTVHSTKIYEGLPKKEPFFMYKARFCVKYRNR